MLYYFQFVGDKVAYALSKGLKVIACVGETLEQRESGSTLEVVAVQTKANADSGRKSTTSNSSRWSVYLILSTNAPIRTYVGVTTDFSRRLRQHNGELKGGAKAARAGRPWICACIIDGFVDRSEACEFESKWKGLSKRLPRHRKKSHYRYGGKR
ncbi:unnamed protein product [Rhodiola kirilowii]